MDDLSISPEELENIVSGDSAQSSTPEPPAAETGSGDDAPLSQDDINRLLAEQTGGGAPSTPAPSPMATQITPEELSKITGAQPISPASVSPAPTPAAAPQSGGSGVTARPAQFAPLQPVATNGVDGGNLDLLLGVNLRVTVELGRTRMSIEEILKLGPGSVVELDKLAGEPVDVLINDRLIARGEVVVIDDRFGVRITDVVPAAQRVHSMQ